MNKQIYKKYFENLYDYDNFSLYENDHAGFSPRKLFFEKDILVTNVRDSFYTTTEKYDGSTFVLGVKYEIGGVSGGSCWEDSRPESYSTDHKFDKEEFFMNLDKMGIIDLDVLSLREYFDLGKKIIDWNISDIEYYGNRVDYKIYGITLQIIDNEIKIK